MASSGPTVREAATALVGAPWRATSGSGGHDGWIGTREQPGYRAGAVIVKLSDLPGIDPVHLYFDLLLLGEDGRTDETHSGVCSSLRRDQPLDLRSRFVRVVAELLRHAPDPSRGLWGLGPALTYLRENGIEGPQLALAAQQLDAACSEDALVASLCHVLTLSLGEDDACDSLTNLLTRLAPGEPIEGDLSDRVGLLVRRAGKAQARRRLRETIDFELLPSPELLGL